jgi:long-chain acyl-CoA synthetase
MSNFYEQFAAAAARFPESTAVEVQHREAVDRFTYAQLRSMAEHIAAFLAAPGPASGTQRLARGDRAAILADNDARWCAAYLGALRLGGVAVPFDTAYKPKQIAALLRDSGARILFTAPKYLPAAQEALALAGTAAELVLLYRPPPGSAAGLENFDNILAAPAADLPPCPATAADPAVILYTSGTTSDPKGVVLTHGNLLAEREAAFQVVRVDERDTILGVLPLFHALAQMANLLLPLSVGARVVFLETVNSAELLRALAERGITAFCCVPQFFYLIHQRVTQGVAAAGFARRLAFRALLRLNGWLRDVARINLGPAVFRRVHQVLGPCMRLLVTGGSRFDPAIGRDLYRLGFTVRQAYGLTESSGGACVTLPDGKYTDSVGPPLPGVEVKILPSKQASEDESRDGEVLLRGAIVMPGYFHRPDASAEALAGGWLHTGDLGYLDADGQLHITGRSKEIIVLSSGKNIYPEEIEAHYGQSPYIKDLCVLGRARPEEPAAERLHAIVVPDFDVLRERKVLNAREVLRFEIEGLSIHLPSHKRILSYEIWTGELPRTTTRKLKRFEIERRIKEKAALALGAADAQDSLTAADLAWADRPEVARALALVRAAAKQPAAIRPDANIELELGLDSMERVELLIALQRLFGTQVPDEVAHRIYTVRELVEACLPLPSASGAMPAPIAAPAADGDAWGRLLEPSGKADAAFADLLEPRPVFAVATFLLLKLCYGFARLSFRFRVTGRENLPAQGPFLLCPNHQSYMDPFFVVSALPYRVFREVFFVGASEYFATPLRRWLARKIHLVPADPDTNLLRAMQAGAFGLRHGKVLVLFPEGERSIDGTVKTFKKGAPILSLHLRAPMVPVALDGVFDIWPRGRGPRWSHWLPGGPGRVSLCFGAPIAPPRALPAGVTLAEAESRYAAAAERLRATVLEMWRVLHRQPRAAGML